MRDLVTLNSKIVELSSLSKNTKEIIMYVHTLDEENANGLTFTSESTQNYKDTLINKPVVVRMNTEETDFKGHEATYDSNGKLVKLDTIPIGTITNCWIEERTIDNDEKKMALMAKATIWSYKFPTAVEIMQELLSQGNLDTSVEVAILSYTSDSEQAHRKAEIIEYLSNCVLGSTIIPADSNAGVVEMFYKEIAEALKSDVESDLNNNNTLEEGGRIMETTEVFNKGFEIKFNGQLENCELSFTEISSQIYDVLNPVGDEGSRTYNYWIRECFASYVIVEDWNTGKDLFQVDYSISENKVTLTEKDQWIAVEQIYVPKGQTLVNQALKDEVEKLQNEIAELKQVEQNVQSKDEALISLNSQIEALKLEIESLNPIKLEYEQIQKEKADKELQEKQANLKLYALNSKVIEENEFEENEELKKALMELNESYVKTIIADRIVEKAKTIETASSDDVSITIPEREDLIPKSIAEKYGL